MASEPLAGLTPALVQFLGQTDVGVLGVRRKDGTVHQSVVYHVVEDGKILISTEPTRLKGRSVQRDGWASYCVHGVERPFPALTVEGPARLLVGPGTARPTTDLFAKIFGEPPAEPLTDDAVVAMNRAIIELTPSRVYSVRYLEP